MFALCLVSSRSWRSLSNFGWKFVSWIQGFSTLLVLCVQFISFLWLSQKKYFSSPVLSYIFVFALKPTPFKSVKFAKASFPCLHFALLVNNINGRFFVVVGVFFSFFSVMHKMFALWKSLYHRGILLMVCHKYTHTHTYQRTPNHGQIIMRNTYSERTILSTNSIFSDVHGSIFMLKVLVLWSFCPLSVISWESSDVAFGWLMVYGKQHIVLCIFRWGHCWEMGRNAQGPFRVLQCHLEQRLKLKLICYEKWNRFKRK